MRSFLTINFTTPVSPAVQQHL